MQMFEVKCLNYSTNKISHKCYTIILKGRVCLPDREEASGNTTIKY